MNGYSNIRFQVCLFPRKVRHLRHLVTQVTQGFELFWQQPALATPRPTRLAESRCSQLRITEPELAKVEMSASRASPPSLQGRGPLQIAKYRHSGRCEDGEGAPAAAIACKAPWRVLQSLKQRKALGQRLAALYGIARRLLAPAEGRSRIRIRAGLNGTGSILGMASGLF